MNIIKFGSCVHNTVTLQTSIFRHINTGDPVFQSRVHLVYTSKGFSPLSVSTRMDLQHKENQLKSSFSVALAHWIIVINESFSPSQGEKIVFQG